MKALPNRSENPTVSLVPGGLFYAPLNVSNGWKNSGLRCSVSMEGHNDGIPFSTASFPTEVLEPPLYRQLGYSLYCLPLNRARAAALAGGNESPSRSRQLVVGY